MNKCETCKSCILQRDTFCVPSNIKQTMESGRNTYCPRYSPTLSRQVLDIREHMGWQQASEDEMLDKLMSETKEVLRAIKRYKLELKVNNNVEKGRNHLIEELGDQTFVGIGWLALHGMTVDDVLKRTIEKLKERHGIKND